LVKQFYKISKSFLAFSKEGYKVLEKCSIERQKIDTGNNNIAVAAGGKTSLKPSMGCLWWQPCRR
jgi:hypothetical protein